MLVTFQFHLVNMQLDKQEGLQTDPNQSQSNNARTVAIQQSKYCCGLCT